MKKIFLMVIIALIGFSGCATDGVYDVGKAVYKGSKEVVKQNKDLISEKTMKSLKNVDRVATGYDTLRGAVTKKTAMEKYNAKVDAVTDEFMIEWEAYLKAKKPLTVDINSTKTE